MDSGCPIGQSRRVGYRKIHVAARSGATGSFCGGRQGGLFISFPLLTKYSRDINWMDESVLGAHGCKRVQLGLLRLSCFDQRGAGYLDGGQYVGKVRKNQSEREGGSKKR